MKVLLRYATHGKAMAACRVSAKTQSVLQRTVNQKSQKHNEFVQPITVQSVKQLRIQQGSEFCDMTLAKMSKGRVKHQEGAILRSTGEPGLSIRSWMFRVFDEDKFKVGSRIRVIEGSHTGDATIVKWLLPK